jgi:hypothetical protein
MCAPFGTIRTGRRSAGPRPWPPWSISVGRRACRRSESRIPSPLTTRPGASASATTATSGTTRPTAAATEVGARWLEDEWHAGEPVPHLLRALHDTFGGQANLAVLTASGDAHLYAGNGENPVFTFRLGSIGLAGTGIYSLDRSLFKFVAPAATARRLVPIRRTVSLDAGGQPTVA